MIFENKIKEYVKNKFDLFDIDEVNDMLKESREQCNNKLKCNEELHKELIKKNKKEIKNELSKLLKDAIFANKEGKFNYSYVYNDLKIKINEIIDKLNEN